MIYKALFTEENFSVEPEFGVVEQYYHSKPNRYGVIDNPEGLWHVKYRELNNRFGLLASIEKTKSIAASRPFYIRSGEDGWLVPFLNDIYEMFKEIGFGNNGWDLRITEKDLRKFFIKRYSPLGATGLSKAIFAIGFLEAHIFGDGIFYPPTYWKKDGQRTCSNIKSFLDEHIDARWIFSAFRDTSFMSTMTKKYFRGVVVIAVVPDGETLSFSHNDIEEKFVSGDTLILRLLKYNNAMPNPSIYVEQDLHEIESQRTRHDIVYACTYSSDEISSSYSLITYLIPDSWVVTCNSATTLSSAMISNFQNIKGSGVSIQPAAHKMDRLEESYISKLRRDRGF